MLDLEGTAFATELRRDYVRHAVYHFFRGRTFEDNLHAARNQIAAERLKARLLSLGLTVPSLDEVRACAPRYLPADQIVDHPVA